MAVLKCKMCGGELHFSDGASTCECEYCGNTNTLPIISSDQEMNLFNRANHFRAINEFDKAINAYEKILDSDDTNAEAHWGVVLSRYGIEYVEDPVSHERIPTCHRVQLTSIMSDPDFLAAVEHADFTAAAEYKRQAERIAQIQKGILSISSQEKPYDVFICYKETDDNGRRTIDSTLAQDIYYGLTESGYRVFFSRITLEDKLGQEYEPYIFAALNSAKVMVVVGTKPEFFNAVWVKNEWSRYLDLMKNDRHRLLIPCYRDMDPYDLPDELSMLQSQDMAKIGFMLDLIRGIKKIVESDKPKEKVVVSDNTNTSPLLKRAFMFLEDGEWSKADDFCEQVLNQDPENAQAYLGKLMAELCVRRQEDLPNCEQPFNNSNNYKKAVRFGSDQFKEMLSGYIEHIIERNENARLTGIYHTAVSAMKAADTEAEFKMAAETFKTILYFKDANELANECLDRAEACRKDAIYADAVSQMTGNIVSSYETAIQKFSTISGWKDVDEQVYACQKKIEEIKLEQIREAELARIEAEKTAKKRKKTITISMLIIIVCIASIVLLTTVIIPKQKYYKAMRMLDSGDYEAAYSLLEELGKSDVIASNKYDRAISLIDNQDYEAAYSLLEELGKNDVIASNKYDRAISFINSGDYEGAYLLLDGLDYKDSTERLNSIKPEYSRILLTKATVGSIIPFGSYEQDNNTVNGKEDIEWLVLAKEGNRALVISKYALDCQNYHNSYTSVTWETCSLRTWLNEDFINAAFSSEEQAMIQNTTVTVDDNLAYNTPPGNNTTDKVFLLSITEVEKYFNSDDERQCQGTAYCNVQGASKDQNGNCWWWLRSPGHSSSYAAYVYCGGGISLHGKGIAGWASGTFGTVRPALWINLEPSTES